MSNCEQRITNEKSPFALRHSPFGLNVRLGLAQAGDAVAVLPLAAFLEEFGALEALENIALAAKFGHRAQTGML